MKPLVFQDGLKHVLNVGCGPARRGNLHRTFRGAEWREIRVDIDPAVSPDVVADILSMPQVPDCSVDAVWSSHNLEHLHAHEVPRALEEFFRVLKAGGFLLVTVPDLQRASECISRGRLEQPVYQSPSGPIAAIDMVFGQREKIAKGNAFQVHKTGFITVSLGEKLAGCGFERVHVFADAWALWGVGHKPSAGGSPQVTSHSATN